MYYIGVDLGQVNDYTAISIIEQIAAEDGLSKYYHLKQLGRLPLNTSYPETISKIKDIVNNLKGERFLIIDQTGVGRPIFDALIAAQLDPVGITITGGNVVTGAGSEYGVPKRDIVNCLQLAYQNKRLRVTSKIKLLSTFLTELSNFKIKINIRTMHDSYEGWREGDHDDLVLSVGLALWYAENQGEPRIRWI